MNITRDNYEVFFLDYLEGNLEENHIDQFLDFLEQNPDLKEELQLFENISLPEEDLLFSDKESLYKKSVYEKELLENKFVAYLENDLQARERELFESWLADNPEFQHEYQLFAKTRLAPDSNVVFPAKKLLYRKPAKVLVLNWVTRVAAVVVLLWGVSTVFQKQNPTGKLPLTPEIAEIESPVQAIENTPEWPDEKNQLAKIEKYLNRTDSKSVVPKKNPEKKEIIRAVTKPPVTSENTEREIMVIPEMQPILARLETQSEHVSLSLERIEKSSVIKIEPEVLTLDEFLAMRAKKVSNEGWLSAQRIVRTGLGIASELSGERIGYVEKDGKIASLEFESRLLAFSIPLEKK